MPPASFLFNFLTHFAVATLAFLLLGTHFSLSLFIHSFFQLQGPCFWWDSFKWQPFLVPMQMSPNFPEAAPNQPCTSPIFPKSLRHPLSQ